MKGLPFSKRSVALGVLLAPLLALFGYVALRSGPLAPVPVTVAAVESRGLAPGLFGIGTVEARFTYRIGPTYAGRVRRLDVHVGELVEAGQLLGEMDPVDLDERIIAQAAAMKRARAQLSEARARLEHAREQGRRYEQLLEARAVSEEAAATKRQEWLVAKAGEEAAGQELARVRAEGLALRAQRGNLRLVAPVRGLVVAREVDPATTVVAGQTVVELIDPESLWVNVRFDQIHASGLDADLPARIVLRSQAGAICPGRVLRVEPLADAVTEETMAKVVFEPLPDPRPPVGELAEVTISLPALPAGPVLPNAAIHRQAGKLGVWKVVDGDLRFTPVSLGVSDLAGNIQVLDGVQVGDRVVVYSARGLQARSRIEVVEKLPEAGS